jgi:hypothetical protein
MKNITENAALHPNEDPLPVFRVVDGVVLQVASGPVAGLTPISLWLHKGELIGPCRLNGGGLLDLGRSAPLFPLFRLRFAFL